VGYRRGAAAPVTAKTKQVLLLQAHCKKQNRKRSIDTET
jgi:hypothetical protein